MSDKKENATRQGGANETKTNQLNSKNGNQPISTGKPPKRVLSPAEMIQEPVLELPVKKQT
jgi:hypothetical protein